MYIDQVQIGVKIFIQCVSAFGAHMEDWETECVASLNKDFFIYLLSYLVTMNNKADET